LSSAQKEVARDATKKKDAPKKIHSDSDGVRSAAADRHHAAPRKFADHDAGEGRHHEDADHGDAPGEGWEDKDPYDAGGPTWRQDVEGETSAADGPAEDDGDGGAERGDNQGD
jgi:hypothetical protein